MSLYSSLKKLYIRMIMNHDPRFTVPRKKQELILNSFAEPRDCVERSFYQYQCQKRMSLLTNLLFSIIAPFAVIYKLSDGKRKKSHSGVEVAKGTGLVCVLAGIERDRIPLSLTQKYENVLYSYGNTQFELEEYDIEWLKRKIISRYPFSFLFQLKAIERVGHYRYIINTYSPKAIANHMEYSCCSSLLTEYCHSLGITHIDFMHGEKPYYIRDSFFYFDEVYVWNEHYLYLFKELRADWGNCFIEIPPMFHAGNDYALKAENVVDYVYYLSNESQTQLIKINTILLELIRKGNTVRIRPHPRWNSAAQIKHIFKEIEIENEMTIVDSIMTTKNVISLFSTVLFQGYLNGNQIVIDDLSDIKKYKMISDLEYISLHLPHTLLSDILNERFDRKKTLH